MLIGSVGVDDRDTDPHLEATARRRDEDVGNAMDITEDRQHISHVGNAIIIEVHESAVLGEMVFGAGRVERTAWREGIQTFFIVSVDALAVGGEGTTKFLNLVLPVTFTYCGEGVF